MSLPTIESSYVMHTTKGIKGFNHPDYPAFRVALEVLNATESYLWVCMSSFDSKLLLISYLEALYSWQWLGLWCICIARRRIRIAHLHALSCKFILSENFCASSTSFGQSSNSIGAFKEASTVLKGLADGSVCYQAHSIHFLCS